MSFQQQVGNSYPILTRISSNSATAVVDGNASAAGKGIFVHQLLIQETANAATALTVDLYDGTTAFILGDGTTAWTAKAVTAKQSVRILDIMVAAGQQIRVTSGSVTGGFDVIAIAADKINA